MNIVKTLSAALILALPVLTNGSFAGERSGDPLRMAQVRDHRQGNEVVPATRGKSGPDVRDHRSKAPATFGAKPREGPIVRVVPNFERPGVPSSRAHYCRVSGRSFVVQLKNIGDMKAATIPVTVQFNSRRGLISTMIRSGEIDSGQDVDIPFAFPIGYPDGTDYRGSLKLSNQPVINWLCIG